MENLTTRRSVLIASAAGLVSGVVFASSAIAQEQYIEGTFPAIKAGKPYAGVVLNVPNMKGWASFAPALELTGTFEEMTGITVEYDMIPGGEIQSKQLLALAQGQGSYDIITQHAGTFGSFFRFLQPIDVQIEETFGSNEAFMDWVFPAQKGVVGPDGKQYWMPFHANAQIGYYRKELFDDPEEQENFKSVYGYALAPPETVDQISDVAEFFTRPEDGLWGLTANWGGDQGFIAFVGYYSDAGFDLLDENNEPTMKTPEGRAKAIEILDFMRGSIHRDKFVNPDSANFQTGQVSDFFLSGASAMGYGWLSDYWSFMQDPENIQQSGPVGSFRFPSFGGKPMGGYSSWWVMGIPNESKQPEAAWEYIKWLLNESPQVEMAAGQLPPIKELAYQTAVSPGGINPPALYDAFVEAKITFPLPELTQQPRTEGIELYTQLIADQITPEEFVDGYVEVIEKTLTKAGYIK